MKLTEKANRAIADIATRHGASPGAVEHLLAAVVSGGGRQAQFNHPELGGMGQWSAGGMTMVGDMFNTGLKAKVADLCRELVDLSRDDALMQPETTGAGIQADRPEQTASSGGHNWWPDGLGDAGSTGSQNDLRYAVFPGSKRLAIRDGTRVTVYDTGDHRITGFSQQQGRGQSISFTSQHGPVGVAELREVGATANSEEAPAQPAPDEAREMSGAARTVDADGPAGNSEHDIFGKIERLAALHAKGILQDEEFQAKKRELLDRL